MTENFEIREAEQLEGVPPPEYRRDVYGHKSVWDSVMRRLDGNRLPGALLLHGPQGIGKATLAFQVARRVLEATGDEDPGRVAEQLTAGAHPNLFVLRRQPKDGKGFYTVIRVDDIRELRDRMRRTRGRAGHRIAIIDSIDDCNASAANALLKTLEEPPSETLFVLVSHRPGQLLPTIRSRCHILPMRPVSNEHVRRVIAETLTDVPAPLLDQAVSLAKGRPRRGFEALTLGEQSTLLALHNWLAVPSSFPPAAHIELAGAIQSESSGAQAGFARDIIGDWLAGEARAAAMEGSPGRMRLASAIELWEKAHAQFAEADSLNLDQRQTLIAILDAIRAHVQKTRSASTEPS